MQFEKNSLLFYIITLISIICIFVIIYIGIFLKIDLKSYFNYILNVNDLLANEQTRQLINANTIVNLPYINIKTNHNILRNIQSCQSNPILLTTNTTQNEDLYMEECVNKCGNRAEIIIVDANNEFYQNNSRLQTGLWCMLNPPNCNTKTTFINATINGVMCVSKFPRLIGGETGNDIVACNTINSFNSDNVLWDRRFNRRVNLSNLIIDHEDEILEDGSYRFVCRFGDDANGNALIEHPFDRFIPQEDKCINNVYMASRQAQTVFVDGKQNYYCECGIENETRLTNEDPNDKQTPCTGCIEAAATETSDTAQIRVRCYNINSLLSNLGTNLIRPCGPSRFTRYGNECQLEAVKMNVTEVTPVNSTELNAYFNILTRGMPLESQLNSVNMPNYVEMNRMMRIS